MRTAGPAASAGADPPRRSPRGRPNSNLVLIGTAVACFIATHTMMGLFVPLYAIELGATPALVGGLVSLAYLLPLVLAMPIGSLVDEIGSRGPIAVASGALTVLPIAVWLAPSLWTLAAVQGVAGIAHLTLVVAAQRYVSGLGRGRVAESNFGWYSTFQSGGQMIGPLLGGLMIDALGNQPAFLFAGALASVAFVLSRFMQPGTRTDSRHVSPFGDRGQVGSLLRNFGMRMAMVISCGVLVAQAVRQTFLPVYLEGLEYSAGAIGLLISLRALMSMGVRPFMPRIVRTLGGRAGAALTMTGVLALGLGMTAFVESFAPLAFTALLVGLGAGITQPLSIVTVTDHVPAKRVGFALGLRLTGNRLAQVVSPALVGMLAELLGVRWAFLAGAASLLVTQALILLWRAPFERAEKDLEAVEPPSAPGRTTVPS